MMSRVSVIFLCFIAHGCTKGSEVAASLQNQPPLKWSNGEKKIGEGVTVNAYIFYDTDQYRQEVPEQNVTNYFTRIFFQAQQHFHNNSVMISLDIRNISMNTHLEVKERGKEVLDGNATLKLLQNYSETHRLTNDSIIYLYTNRTPVDKVYSGAALPGLFSTFSTFGTFCSNTSSAAIISQPPSSWSYWLTVQATAEMFGTRNFAKFKVEDIEEMNKTFLHCHAKEISQSSKED
ncbi:uncharacterized protein [Dermacentor andersoni]|uniref:uncharacterized protein n=1 Tax=Dermacentor andersoni TaxID=34620 RepID=UPI002417FE6D|nr:uncharacterized protein LOC126544527 [Dermacentor andersoni]